MVSSIFSFIKIRTQTLRKRAKNLQEQVDLKTMELRSEKEKVEEQHKIIARKNQNITASINYARRIQNSVLPIKENITKILPESFVFIKPKDIVSGDFCWFTEIDKNGNPQDKLIIVAAIDCTGHGIPGAFMSLVGNSLLNDVIHKGIVNPSKILEKLHEEIIVTLKKEEKDSATVDGMDVSLCVIDRKNRTLEFASTGQPLILVKNGKTEIIRSGKYPIGLVLKKERYYETYKFSLEEKDIFYIFSDGYIDQFGGPDDEKFSEVRFEKLVSGIHHLEMNEQEKIIAKTMEDWKGNNPQLDDILVIGMR
jgi:serine phosphatase RsbU (regulator of sigma subunit)